MIEKAATELGIAARFTATLFAHHLKYIQGQYPAQPDFSYDKVFNLLKFLTEQKLDVLLAKRILPHLYQHPNMDFESLLVTVNFKAVPEAEILAKVPFLVKKFMDTRKKDDPQAGRRWIMGNLNRIATGNIPMAVLCKAINL
jgi:glutamyl-tRNA(Gln) amidotransferase subunit E